MKYENVVKGRFVSRPNRFIAYVDIDGEVQKVHVRNTGRCRELLTDNAQVYLVKSNNPERSTAYDLVAVKKGDRIINMDSQAPNKAVEEWLYKGELFPDVVMIRPETIYKNSRFDFYVETTKEKIFIEVKGVTLEQEDVALFPDAPSERALKHVNELIGAVKEGYKAYVLFVVQMKNVKYFTPNRITQPAFANALSAAREAGVEVLAYDCQVEPGSMKVDMPVPVRLSVLDEIAEALLTWYDQGHRSLPWREDPTPYHVWVSEIMLQQTRVEAVKSYYAEFMKELPDIAHLADVEEEKYLKLWEGLGYYNRVRNLNKAARMIMEDYAGRMPEDYEELKKLPGIGNYTAGAISSIAYGKVAAAVDGNVLRVLSRLRADERDIMQQPVRTQIEKELFPVIPKERPGDFNQALMELGAMVCIPNGEPKCAECPWENICMAHQQGTEQEYPKKAAKKERSIEKKTVLILRDENKAALCKRPERGLLAGMYEFPCLDGHLSGDEVVEWLKKEGLSVIRIEPLMSSKHIFTHKEWHMIGYDIRVDELAPKKADNGMIFVERGEARDKYAIPSAYRAYLNNFLI